MDWHTLWMDVINPILFFGLFTINVIIVTITVRGEHRIIKKNKKHIKENHDVIEQNSKLIEQNHKLIENILEKHNK